jgi:ankyrin repeat protein
MLTQVHLSEPFVSTTEGGDVNVRDSLGDSPLIMAAEQEQGASKIIKMLCDAGANIDERAGASNETPLILAAYYGDTELVMFLVEECGANLEVKSGRGDTGKTKEKNTYAIVV